MKVIQDKLIQRDWAPKPMLNQTSRSIDDITVGSVERFQGNERKVIILSTVRGPRSKRPPRNKVDPGKSRSREKIYPGKSLAWENFLNCSQRFNVAITRAREVLIVIGDDRLLIKNKNWRELIMYTKKNGSYIENC